MVDTSPEIESSPIAYFHYNGRQPSYPTNQRKGNGANFAEHDLKLINPNVC